MQCFNVEDIVNNVALILSHAREKDQLVSAGRVFVEQNKGALGRTVEVINHLCCTRTNPDINLTDTTQL